MSTGWFGIAGSFRLRDSTKVHYVSDKGRSIQPLCGVRLRRQMEFQWCSSGYDARYIECSRCRAKASALKALARG
jgi:hypothetical protein